MLFSDTANPPEAFDWLLRTGQVRILGMRLGRVGAPEAIEDWLRRANETLAFEVAIIRPETNEITLSLTRIARNRLGSGYLTSRSAIEAQLADVFGAEWREYWRSGLTFGAVRVELASLRDAMVAAGYMLPEPAVSDRQCGRRGTSRRGSSSPKR